MHASPDLLRLRNALLAATVLPAWGCGSTSSAPGAPAAEPADIELAGAATAVPELPPRPAPAGSAAPAPVEVGYEKRADQVLRVGPAECVAEVLGPSCRGDESLRQCRHDRDCTEGPRGRCVSTDVDGVWYCGCVYACKNDAECGDGEVCVCGAAVDTPTGGSVCAPATCTDAASCATGECAVSSRDAGCGIEVQVACRTPSDECRVNADCPYHCAPAEDRWECVGITCAQVLGRRLVVNGRAATASHRTRSDWLEVEPELGPEPPLPASRSATDARALAASHYRGAAALEHASVASFARFSLQLLSLGAPPELVAESQRSGLDEIEHAQAFYAVAAALDGRHLGPGPLPEATTPIDTDAASMVVALVRDGCVGEAIAAAEAAHAAHDCTSDTLRATLRRIGEDETRHAALAWRSLAWLISSHPELRREAERALRSAVAWATATPDAAPGLPAWGILSGASRAALRRRVVHEVFPASARALGLALFSGREATTNHPRPTGEIDTSGVMVGRWMVGLSLVALWACGDDGGSASSAAGGGASGPGGSGASSGTGASGTGASSSGGSGGDGPCIEDSITFRGTANGQDIDLELLVEGHSGEQIGPDKRWSYSFDGGHVGFAWTGDYIGTAGMIDVTGTVVWGAQTADDSRYCWEGTVERVGEYDEIRILAMTELVDVGATYDDPPVCGDPVTGTLDVCVWNDAP